MSHVNDSGGKHGIGQIKVNHNARVHIGNHYSVEGLGIEQKCHRAFSTCTYTAFKDGPNPKRVPGTCEWAFQHPYFQKWQRSKQNGVLWISADPGCGKSVLAKAFVDESLEASENSVCHFFFKDNAVQDKLNTALCAMLHQLFCQEPQLLCHAVPSFEKYGNRIQHETQEMWEILVTASMHAKSPVICVFDALDECGDDDRRRLVDLLCRFQNSTTAGTTTQRLRILATGRPYDNVTRWFSALEGELPEIRLRGEEENDQISKEIDLVLEIHVLKLGTEFSLPSTVLDKLRKSLQNMRHRTYLWLYLAIDSVRNRFRHSRRANSVDIQEIVLPKDVNEAYEQLLNRVDKDVKQTVKDILTIIVGARRPFSIREMFMALNLIESEEDSISADDFDETRFERQIRDWCGLFVYINHSELFLIHQTAKEFLLGTPSHNEMIQNSWKSCLRPQEVESVLAVICVSYLSHRSVENMLREPFKVTVQRWKHPEEPHDLALIQFLGYCAHEWFRHLESSKSVGTLDFCRKVVKLCDNISPSWTDMIWLETKDLYHSPNDSGMLMQHLFSMTKCVTVLRCLTYGGATKWDTFDGSGRTPLIGGVETGHLETVSFLVEIGADLDLCAGKNYNHNLLGRDYFPDMRGERFTALQVACKMGRLDIASFLITKGAKTFAPEPKQSGPRHHGKSIPVKLAVWHNNMDLTITLAEWRITVLDNALCKAARLDNEKTVTMFLEHGADVDGLGNGFSPLVEASRNGNLSMVEILLTAGADVNTKKAGYGAALSAAVAPSQFLFVSGNNSVVGRLLKAGADVNLPKGSQLRSPLAEAANDGNVELFSMLLNAGADIYSRSGHVDQTVLQIASKRAQLKIVKIILRQISAAIDSVASIELIGSALLTAATEYSCSEEAVELLLDTGQINEKVMGEALITATQKGHDKVVQKLYEKGSGAITPEQCQEALGIATTLTKRKVVAVILSFTSHCNQHVALQQPPVIALGKPS